MAFKNHLLLFCLFKVIIVLWKSTFVHRCVFCLSESKKKPKSKHKPVTWRKEQTTVNLTKSRCTDRRIFA